MYKATLWNGIRFPEGHVYEDTRTTYKIFNKANSITTISDVLYMYRDNPKGISKTQSYKNLCDHIIALNELGNFISDNVPDIFSRETEIDYWNKALFQMKFDYSALIKYKHDKDDNQLREWRKLILKEQKETEIRGGRTIIIDFVFKICPSAVNRMQFLRK